MDHEFDESPERQQVLRNDNGLGQMKPNLCEVVYVNHVWPGPDESAFDLIAEIFTGLSWQHSTEWLPEPEAAALNRVYVIGENRGRLYAEASIAHQKERGEFVLLKMVARVLHRPDDSVESCLHLAHDWVVHGFVSLTDEKVRKERWKQTA